MEDRDGRWAELELLLRSAVAQIRHSLDAKTAGLLDDFIENREFEVALLWLLSAAQEQRVALSQETTTALDRAASLMEIQR